MKRHRLVHKCVTLVFITFLFAVPPVSAQTASDNPFLQMAGRPYNEYAARLPVLIDSVESRPDYIEASFRLLKLWEKRRSKRATVSLNLQPIFTGESK
ncbi:MAG: hypothetical protein LBN11_05995 [Tannerella sp.]|nr:hypothetical protein [Tannerella sp.]